MRTAYEVRLLSGAIIDFETGCWLWSRSIDRYGYGKTSFERKTISAHRAMYKLLMGPIPADLELDHLCHTMDTNCAGGHSCIHRRCVNPAHLEPVTFLENQRRSPLNFVVANAEKTHCPAGHEYRPENTRITNGSRHCRICNLAAVKRYQASAAARERRRKNQKRKAVQS